MSLVAIVGRPNVGKSTLFNRLVGERKAIVDSTAGTTRDRHYGKTDWNGKEFSVIDTGGYTVNSDDIFEDGLYPAGHSAEGGDRSGGALPGSAEEAGQSVHKVAAEESAEQSRYDSGDSLYHGRNDSG